MKIVFMGTPDFAASSLMKLIESKHEVVAVLTKEDKAKGRGHEIQFTPVKEIALEHNIEVIQPTRVKGNEELFDTLRSYEADIFVVVAYGKILPKEVLDMPRLGCINVHGSLLPKYRGAAPIQWSVINGDEKTGVTTMLLDEGMDTGDMLLKAEIPILSEDTAETIFDKLSILGADLLIETLDGMEKNEIIPVPQNHEEATHAKMLTKQDGEINWDRTSKELFHFVRGMTPWPAAYTNLGDKVIKILDLEILDDEFLENKVGEIVAIDSKKGFVVKTKDKSLLITRVHAQNSKAMSAADFMRGNNIELGNILGK